MTSTPRVADTRSTGTVRAQIVVLGGQFTAGLGNLVFAMVLARILVPGDYAAAVSFLALFVLLHVPVIALSAAGAIAPERIAAWTRPVLAASLAVAVVLAAASPVLSEWVGLPLAVVLILACAAPVAGLLSLNRGLAYGREEHVRVSLSLFAEAAARLALGVPLALTLGVTGAALGTVAGGLLALLVLVIRSGRGARTVAGDRLAGGSPVGATAAMWTGLCFILVALLQSTDVLVANKVLDSASAATFGVLSTLGGAAFFATATIPMVLMPAVVRGRANATRVALVLTTAIGLAITAFGLAFADSIVEIAFGSQYVGAAPWVGPYLFAMAVLGLVRVQVAKADAAASARSTVLVMALSVAVLALLIGFGARTVGGVVVATLSTACALAVMLALFDLARRRRAARPKEHS